MRFRILFCLIIIGLGASISAFAFNEPSLVPPAGSVSAPILSGDVDQTRYGPLEIGGVNIADTGEFINRSDLITSGNLNITNNSELCLVESGVSQCLDNWNSGYNQLVRLSPSEADHGFIHLNGQATFVGATNTDYSLYTRAIAPNQNSTYGFKGLASNQSSINQSYGALGIAAHNGSATGRLAYGIFGWDSGNSNAYAGYFTGNVEIVGSQLCFFNGENDNLGTCLSAWPVSGPADDLLKLQTRFPLVAQAGVTAVNGAGRFTSAVLGDPNGKDISVTCGDGVCSETTASCPIDCPEISAVSASWIDATTASFNWTSNTLMNSVVQYGANDQYGDQFSDEVDTVSHSIQVTDLTNVQSYHFRVGGRTSGSGIITFSLDGVLSGVSDLISPPAPTSPTVTIHLSPPSPNYVYFSWAHPGTDLPESGGSGFKGYNIYRKIQGQSDSQLPIAGPLTTREYRDDTPNQGTIYEYSVSAVDQANNESTRLRFTVHVPVRCTTNADCTAPPPEDPGYPWCCTGYDGLACSNQECTPGGSPGSSPIMSKQPANNPGSSPIMQKTGI